MISHRACLEEFIKLAEAVFRPISVSGKRVQLQSNIPLIRRLPADSEMARQKLIYEIGKSKGRVLGRENVALDAKAVFPRLHELGFKKTRLSVPLPGNAPFTPSWRSGSLHAHRAGPVLLVHEDRISPQGFFTAVSHAVKEGLPALRQRRRSAEVVKQGSAVYPKKEKNDSSFKRWMRSQGRILAEDSIYEAAEVLARNMSRGKYPVGRIASAMVR